MTRRNGCRLLLVLAALCISTAATAGRGGGWYHGGGGYGGGYHAGYGGYGGANRGGGWYGGYRGGYHGGGWYRGGHYGWYGGYYRGWYGCCGFGDVGLYFGPGFIYGYPFYPYDYPPYYAGIYYPYVSGGDPSQPTQYIEQGQTRSEGSDLYDQGSGDGGEAPQLAFWYYCGNPKGYYPYVRTCPGGWQKVPPRPPDS